MAHKIPVTFTCNGKEYTGNLEYMQGTGHRHTWRLIVQDKLIGHLRFVDKKWEFGPEKEPALAALADDFGHAVLQNPTPETRTLNFPSLIETARRQLPDVETFEGKVYTIPAVKTYDVLGMPDISESPKIETFEVSFRKVFENGVWIWDFEAI
jgi:hypothetical protein